MMDQFLTDLCKRHDLTAVSISRSSEDGRFSAFLHWSNGGLAYAWGATCDDAVALALSDMSRNRAEMLAHDREMYA